MQVFGLTITRTKTIPAGLTGVGSRGGWWPIIRESFSGAWQSNVEVKLENVLTFAALYACITLVSADIGKLRIKLVAEDEDGIENETESPAFSPVLRKPNRYQTRIKFLEQWVASKLIHGNTYVLKARDNRGVVIALYVLDPTRVVPLVAPDGSVFYQLNRDDLSTVSADIVAVPAREIIHDVMVPLYHPLCGVSPISACGLAAVQGLRIQNNSAVLFGNKSQPGGILTAPGFIKDETAVRLKDTWEANFSGANMGKIAVLGDGLKYESTTMNAVDAQLIEQLRWTAENVCTAFHVPAYMVGVGPPPNYNNIEALNQQYYSQCLQNLIESIELLLDEGLELPSPYGTELDLEQLLRMDTATKMKAATDGVKGGIYTPNEGRLMFNKPPLAGGDTVYLQEQDHSLDWLSRRDEQAIAPPPALTPPAIEPPALPAKALFSDDLDDELLEAQAAFAFRKEMAA